MHLSSGAAQNRLYQFAAFLAANQQRLAKAGILFPPVTPEGMANFHADAPPRAPQLNDYMGHNALAQIKTQASGMDALVFCSEDLARASLMVPDVPQRFADTFDTQDVTLIAALRRPDEAIAAWQTQRLRFGLPYGALHSDPAEIWLGSVHFEYRAALEPWLRAFRRWSFDAEQMDQVL